MRLVIVALVVAACGQHPGAYIIVTGTQSNGVDTTFDRLEMFFTAPDSQPDTTGTLAPQLINATGPFVVDPRPSSVWTRATPADTDTFPIDGPSSSPLTRAEVRVPYVGGMDMVGSYLLVVARRNRSIIGYAELTNLDVPDDYYKYTLAITAASPGPITNGKVTQWPDGVDTWGALGGPTCARLTANGTNTWVVTAGDSDCDGFYDASEDCAPQLFCDPTSTAIGPVGVQACHGICTIDDTTTTANGFGCSIGDCVNAVMSRSSCNPKSFGRPGVPGVPACVDCPMQFPSSCDHESLASYLACTQPVSDYTCPISTNPDGTLCGTTMVNVVVPVIDPASVACNLTSVQVVLPNDPNFVYAVTNAQPSTTDCTVTVSIASAPMALPMKLQRVRVLVDVPSTSGVTTVELDIMPTNAPCSVASTDCTAVHSDLPASCSG